jgi:hypothetical protein
MPLSGELLKCSPQAGLGQHPVVVFAGELPDAVGTGAHGLLLPVRGGPAIAALTGQALGGQLQHLAIRQLPVCARPRRGSLYDVLHMSRLRLSE